MGDSEPTGWRDMLTEQLDDRHPTRHSICTPIWDRIQERLFTTSACHLDRSALYIRKAVRDAANKPSSLERDWGSDSHVTRAVAELAVVLAEGQPLLVVSLGQFSFELCRRALDEESRRAFGHWTRLELGAEFRRRLTLASSHDPLLVPLLHASIARGEYLDAHVQFSGSTSESPPNYFAHAGTSLADWILQRRQQFEARGGFMTPPNTTLYSTAA